MCERNGKRPLPFVCDPRLQPVSGIDFTETRPADDLHMHEDVSILVFLNEKTVFFQAVELFNGDRFEISC